VRSVRRARTVVCAPSALPSALPARHAQWCVRSRDAAEKCDLQPSGKEVRLAFGRGRQRLDVLGRRAPAAAGSRTQAPGECARTRKHAPGHASTRAGWRQPARVPAVRSRGACPVAGARRRPRHASEHRSALDVHDGFFLKQKKYWTFILPQGPLAFHTRKTGAGIAAWRWWRHAR